MKKVTITINDKDAQVDSVSEFGILLDEIDRVSLVEVWLLVGSGPKISMLRNGENAWLMYQRSEDDAGFTSIGDPGRLGTASYVLSNGQIDEYPLSWCIEKEECYKALVYFYVNGGAQPGWLEWQSS